MSKTSMLATALLIMAIWLTGCSSEKTYFTGEIKSELEASSVPISQVQFYVDRDIELTRELESASAKVTSGKVVLENGKYTQIIFLKKYTPGVCTKALDHSVHISFEPGGETYLEFGQGSRSTSEDPYLIFAKSWSSGYGFISYDNNNFRIEPEGGYAGLMIKKSIVNKLEVQKRTMTGVKVAAK